MSLRAAWLAGLSGAWMAASWPAHRRFQRALSRPEEAQQAALDRVLAGARDSAYGRSLGLARVRTAAEFRSAVPLVTYDDLAPWVERVCAGEPGVLTTHPVLMVEPTGGSSAAAVKYIPYTAALRDEFNRALAPWMFDLYTRRPRLLSCATYWSISPAARAATRTSGGVPIGFAEDADYFSGLERFVMGQLMPVPGAVARLPTLGENRRATLLHLLAEPRLGLISVWNPTFLTLLLDYLDAHADELLRALPPAHARRLGALRRGHLPPGQVWPQLSVVSCWAAAGAARFVPALRERLPSVEVQPKGLLATEGVVTIPLWDQPAPVLAVDSHFYELEPEVGGAPVLAHEAELGRTYGVVLSTSGGLCRYRLRDRVRVAGFRERTPLLEFLGRAEGTVDVCGEKLSEEVVARAVEASLTGLRPAFVLVAPWLTQPPRYVLHLEVDAPPPALVRAAARLEEELRANPHYAYCRDLGQLAPVAAFRIARDGAAAHLAACVARGQRAGDVKAALLERPGGWETAFAGEIAK